MLLSHHAQANEPQLAEALSHGGAYSSLSSSRADRSWRLRWSLARHMRVEHGDAGGPPGDEKCWGMLSRRRDASVTWCVLQIRGKPSISISAWVAQGDDCRMVASWIGPEVNEEGGRWRTTQWQQQEHRSAAVSCWRRTTPLAPLMPSCACCRSIYTDAAILSKFCFTTFLICCINFGGMLQCLDNLFK